MTETSKDILKNIYKPRTADAKKYDFGLLLVIGGSDFYSGSPALSALAAFRAGVDMVKIVAPKRAADIIASFSPDLAAYPLEGRRLLKEHLPILLEMTESAKALARGKTAVVIGGGLGRTLETQEIILEYLSQISVPAIIDADAIYAIAKHPDVFKGKNFLFTPHGYEFFVLTGKEVMAKSDDEKMKIVQEEAARLQTTILLKGKIDMISNGRDLALNKTGTPYMTVGGTGDILAGICGAMMARGINAFISAQAAAYINGKAGEMAVKTKKDGLMASDLLGLIPEVIK